MSQCLLSPLLGDTGMLCPELREPNLEDQIVLYE